MHMQTDLDSRDANTNGETLQPLTEVPNMGHCMTKKGHVVINDWNSLNVEG